jgi:hypothetical protein
MKVVQNTPSQLILRRVPWIYSLVCVFLMLVGGCLALLIFYTSDGLPDFMFGAFVFAIGPGLLGYHFVGVARRDDLILDRSRNLLELRHSTMRGRQTIQHELEFLSRAFLQTQETSKHGTASRVALLLDGGMDEGVHLVTSVYQVGGRAAQTAKTINDWLAKNGERTAVRRVG